VAEATAAEGKAKVEVMGDGECRVCASPCPKVAEKFPDAIKEPKLAAEVEAAKGLGDPQATAEAVAEVLPELEQTQSATSALKELDARIGELEGSMEAQSVLNELESIDPKSPNAQERIAALEERVALLETEGAAPAENVWDATEGSEAARRATVSEQAERLEANKARGTLGEEHVQDLIAAGQIIPEVGQPVTKIVGSQVPVRTAAGDLRIIDHVVVLADGTTVALEVKTDGAFRSASQITRDAHIEQFGGRVTSGPLAGPLPAGIKTIEVNVSP
jgi:hypothetical protein